MRNSIRAALFAALFFATAPAGAAEIKVLAYNAVNIPARELAAAFNKETGHQVNFTFGSPGPVNERLKAEEIFDLVIMATEAAATREASWRPGTRRPLVRVGIGLAVREGVRLDLSTVESTRKALTDARSLTLSDAATGGLSGPNAQKVLANLGIAEIVKSKLRLAPSGQELIAAGEIDIGLYNVSEIPRAKGVALAGPVPAAVQVYIVYDAAVPLTNAAPEPALALARYLGREATRAVWIKGGLEPAGE
ncbi:MAG: ABC transporter substrate-binding protein [Deltaproteobacteria bacterium]|nr:ABC transporter substrate-binding protein [Deltaproteobacteria bacterium]